MGRLILQIVIPLVLPTIVYILWVKYQLKQNPNANIRVKKPWFWLISTGCVLTITVMLFFGLSQGKDPDGTYQPPVYKDGKIIPGHMVPADKPKTE